MSGQKCSHVDKKVAKTIECAKTDKMLKEEEVTKKTFVMSFHILLPFEHKLLRFASEGMLLCLSFVHFLCQCAFFKIRFDC